jgi:hypothetical protein
MKSFGITLDGALGQVLFTLRSSIIDVSWKQFICRNFNSHPITIPRCRFSGNVNKIIVIHDPTQNRLTLCRTKKLPHGNLCINSGRQYFIRFNNNRCQ